MARIARVCLAGLLLPLSMIAALCGSVASGICSAFDYFVRIQPVDYRLAESIRHLLARPMRKINSLIASKITFVSGPARGIGLSFAAKRLLIPPAAEASASA